MSAGALLAASLAGFAVFPGTATDRAGAPLGGISSLRWDPAAGVFLALSDRGPGDGTVPYAPRYHVFAYQEAEGGFRLSLKDSVVFKDGKGEPFSGLIKTSATRLDPEGLAIAPDGTLYVSEEYGPAIHHFARDGRLLESLPVPERYKGRSDNRGFEGLCLAPDGRTLAVLLQSPLETEGGKTGKSTRILLYDLAAAQAPPREHLLAMPRVRGLARAELVMNEIEALSSSEFLVLERDGRGRGEDEERPRYKRVVRVSLRPHGKAGRGESLDLLKVLRAEGLPPKFESLAWGPGPGGSRALWLAIDNDFEPSHPTYFFRLSVP